jgi:hypothetical protein
MNTSHIKYKQVYDLQSTKFRMPDSSSAILIVMKPNGKEKFRKEAALLLYIRRSVTSTNVTHLFKIINIGLHRFKGPSTCDWCRSRIKSSRVPHVIFAFKELNSTASKQYNTVSTFEMENTYC